MYHVLPTGSILYIYIECSVWRKSCSPVGHLFLRKLKTGGWAPNIQKIFPMPIFNRGGFFSTSIFHIRWKKNGWPGEFDQKMTYTEQKKGQIS